MIVIAKAIKKPNEKERSKGGSIFLIINTNQVSVSLPITTIGAIIARIKQQIESVISFNFFTPDS